MTKKVERATEFLVEDTSDKAVTKTTTEKTTVEVENDATPPAADAQAALLVNQKGDTAGVEVIKQDTLLIPGDDGSNTNP